MTKYDVGELITALNEAVNKLNILRVKYDDLEKERDALQAENAVMLAALRRINSSITPPKEIVLQAENEKLREALTEVMVWINEWEPAFIQDEEWRETKRMVRAALGEKE